jgi:Transposase IS66 family
MPIFKTPRTAPHSLHRNQMVHVGCWAHARRKFVDAVKVNANDAEAVKMVLRMDALFVVDREARRRARSLAFLNVEMHRCRA